MRITSKGQVTIPREVREKLGLLPGTAVEFVVKGNTVHLVKATKEPRSRGEVIVQRLRDSATVRMTTDEILRLMRR